MPDSGIPRQRRPPGLKTRVSLVSAGDDQLDRGQSDPGRVRQHHHHEGLGRGDHGQQHVRGDCLLRSKDGVPLLTKFNQFSAPGIWNKHSVLPTICIFSIKLLNLLNFYVPVHHLSHLLVCTNLFGGFLVGLGWELLPTWVPGYLPHLCAHS